MPSHSPPRLRLLVSGYLLWLAAGLYGASFFLTVGNLLYGGAPCIGLQAFLICFPLYPGVYLADGLLPLAWCANPAMWVGLAYGVSGNWKVARWAAAVALAFGLAALPNWYSEIRGYPGYWVWLGSFAVLHVASWWPAVKQVFRYLRVAVTPQPSE